MAGRSVPLATAKEFDHSGLRKVESLVVTHDAQIRAQTDAIRSLQETTDRILTKLSDLGDRISQSSIAARTTDWGNIIGACGLTFAILSALVTVSHYVTTRDVTRIDVAVKEFATMYHRDQVEQSFVRGAGLKDIEQLHAYDKRLDETLQREMRLLDATTNERINAVGLQAEKFYRENATNIKTMSDRQVWSIEQIARLAERAGIDWHAPPNGKN